MRFLPASDCALLVELDSLEQTLALFHAVQQDPPDGVDEVVPAARTLLIQYRPTAVSPSFLAARLQQLAHQDHARPAEAPMRAGRLVEIPVRYNGEDLDAVASLLGLSRAEVIERHAGAEFHAAFVGFAPGFVYLSGGDPCFHGVPRRSTPRTRVPAGSVAMAGEFSAVYPSDSPGGWQLLGVTPCTMWDLERAQPALVQPGSRVRFRDLERTGVTISLPVGKAPGQDIRAEPIPEPESVSPPVAPPDPLSRSTRFEVRAAGLQTLVQDLGRRGQTHMGVSLSGALDRNALRTANRIVGNPSDAPVLENVLGNVHLVCRGRAVVAVTGALAELHITTAAGLRLSAQRYRPLALDDGDSLRIGVLRAGARCYMAVRGAWDVAPVLGSRATDTLAGIGPAPLRAGDVLAVGEARARQRLSAVVPDMEPPQAAPRSGDVVTLDIVLGPRADWFTAQALQRLAGQEWTVTPQSDRVGIRLAGAEPLERRVTGELPSEGTVLGAIQVPASGQPVLFLADHPLTGGYPVIGAVVSRDIDRAAQLPVGVRLHFRPVGPFEDIQP